jgi:hypothetical protein
MDIHEIAELQKTTNATLDVISASTFAAGRD